MTTVEMKIGKETTLSLRGHAGYGIFGGDIVCAGCSVLCYVVAHAALALEDDGLLLDAPNIRIEDGDAKISFHPREGAMERVAAALEPVWTTFCLLAKSYPDNVTCITE